MVEASGKLVKGFHAAGSDEMVYFVGSHVHLKQKDGGRQYDIP